MDCKIDIDRKDKNDYKIDIDCKDGNNSLDNSTNDNNTINSLKIPKFLVLYADSSPFSIFNSLINLECENCSHWNNGKCNIVDGNINSIGYCILFFKRL